MKKRRPTIHAKGNSVVRQLLQKIERSEYDAAIEATAARFGMSKNEVRRAVAGGNFIVRFRG